MLCLEYAILAATLCHVEKTSLKLGSSSYVSVDFLRMCRLQDLLKLGLVFSASLKMF